MGLIKSIKTSKDKQIFPDVVALDGCWVGGEGDECLRGRFGGSFIDEIPPLSKNGVIAPGIAFCGALERRIGLCPSFGLAGAFPGLISTRYGCKGSSRTFLSHLPSRKCVLDVLG